MEAVQEGVVALKVGPLVAEAGLRPKAEGEPPSNCSSSR